MDDSKIIKLIKESGHLPQIPKDFGEILKMLMEPSEYDLEQCVENFTRFPQLENILIQVINYNSQLNRKIYTIKEAINYLGAKNARAIAIAYVTRLLLSDKNGRTIHFSNKRYWKHCLGTAMAASLIAKESELSDSDKMFTYGLIHDIGITILDICLPDYLDRIHEMQLKGLHQIAAEKIVLSGITHAEIGMWLCEEWGLPNEIAEIVGFHHSPMLSKNHVEEVRIMHLGDLISTTYYEKLLGNESTFMYAENIMKSLNVDKAFIDNVIKNLPEKINKLSGKIILF